MCALLRQFSRILSPILSDKLGYLLPLIWNKENIHIHMKLNKEEISSQKFPTSWNPADADRQTRKRKKSK